MMSHNELTFSYLSNNISVVQIENTPYFIAKNICDILGLTRTNDAVEKLDIDEKLMRKISVSGQNRKTWLVNESGLYNLIFRSNKPGAKKFRKWVTSEVLPAIRKTGEYKLESHTITRKERNQKGKQLYLKGMSQKEIAETLSVRQSTVGDWVKKGNWKESKGMNSKVVSIIASAYMQLVQLDKAISKRVERPYPTLEEDLIQGKIIGRIEKLNKLNKFEQNRFSNLQNS